MLLGSENVYCTVSMAVQLMQLSTVGCLVMREVVIAAV